MIDVTNTKRGDILRMKYSDTHHHSFLDYTFVVVNPEKREGHMIDNRSGKYYGLLGVRGLIEVGQPVFFTRDGVLVVTTVPISSIILHNDPQLPKSESTSDRGMRIGGGIMDAQ